MTRAAHKPPPPRVDRPWPEVASEGVAAVVRRNRDLSGPELKVVLAAANPFARGLDPEGTRAWKRAAWAACGEVR